MGWLLVGGIRTLNRIVGERVPWASEVSGRPNDVAEMRLEKCGLRCTGMPSMPTSSRNSRCGLARRWRRPTPPFPVCQAAAPSELHVATSSTSTPSARVETMSQEWLAPPRNGNPQARSTNQPSWSGQLSVDSRGDEAMHSSVHSGTPAEPRHRFRPSRRRHRQQRPPRTENRGSCPGGG